MQNIDTVAIVTSFKSQEDYHNLLTDDRIFLHTNILMSQLIQSNSVDSLNYYELPQKIRPIVKKYS